jgi:hypothetical protein
MRSLRQERREAERQADLPAHRPWAEVRRAALGDADARAPRGGFAGLRLAGRGAGRAELVEEPHRRRAATVQVGPDTFETHARILTDETGRTEAWQLLTAAYPDFGSYQLLTERGPADRGAYA